MSSEKSDSNMNQTKPQNAYHCKRLESAELLDGKNIVEILHNGQIYRLQLTRQNKLILTK